MILPTWWPGKYPYIIGDSMKEMKKLPDECVDLVLTDPPYNISTDTKIIMKNHPKQRRSKDRELVYDFGEWDHFKSDKEYYEFTQAWLFECFRVLKPSGNFVSFFDNSKIEMLKHIWEKLGGRHRQYLYWIKKNPKTRLRKVDFRVAVESMFWGCKSERGHTFNWELGQQDNYVRCAVFLNNERTGHPTQKPTPVLEPWINYLSNPGDIILDPFLGSGTTLRVCRNLYRIGLGYEINPEYEKAIRKMGLVGVKKTDLMKYVR